MREIKFRAWIKYPNGDKLSTPVMRYEVQNWASFGNICKNNTDVIVMQFTGLKDKNGIEIYEGDIVKQSFEFYSNRDNEIYNVKDYGTHTGEVVIIASKGTCLRYPETVYQNHRTISQGYINVRTYRSEIIGNIYENPELLKEIK